MKKELLKFGASWCMPCRSMQPIIDSLIKDGYNIKDIDIEKEPELTEKYKIRNVPTMVLIENDIEIDRKIGLQSKENIIEMLK